MSKTPCEAVRETIENMSDSDLGRWMRSLLLEKPDDELGSLARHMFSEMSDEEITAFHERNERATFASKRLKAKAYPRSTCGRPHEDCYSADASALLVPASDRFPYGKCSVVNCKG